jgi:hypothetical protein
LPGQELLAGNARAYFTLAACEAPGPPTAATLCTSNLDCCGASASPPTAVCQLDPPPLGNPPTSHCVATTSTTCAADGASCTSDAQCCNFATGSRCGSGTCLVPPAIDTYASAPFVTSYQAACATGTYPAWRFYYWESITPNGTSIAFTAQTSLDSVNWGAPVSIGTAAPPPNVTPTWTSGPLTVDQALRAAGQVSGLYLKVIATLIPDSTDTLAPVLTNWRLRRFGMTGGQRAAISTKLALAILASFGGWIACSSARPSALGSSGSTDAGSTDTGTAYDARAEAGAHDAAGVEGGHDAQADGSSDATAPVDAGDSGPGADAGDGGGFPPPPTAVCSATATWGAGVLLTVSTAFDDELDAITPDELTIAWTVSTASPPTIEYADRSTSTDPFGPPQTVAAGSFSTARAALSHDGLRLVVVNADGQGFSELTRTSRMPPGNTFGTPGTGSYVNLDAPGTLAAGESYGDPVLSADDNAFYYSTYGGSLTATIFRTARLLPGDSWPTGAALPASSGLGAQGSLRRQPTAISSDEQTLFFWDQVLSTERAAFIDESTGAFDIFVDLGTRAMAAPNTSCTNLYYSAEGATSVDLFVAQN